MSLHLSFDFHFYLDKVGVVRFVWYNNISFFRYLNMDAERTLISNVMLPKNLLGLNVSFM